MADLARVDFETSDGWCIASISGEIDVSNVDHVRALVDAEIDSGTRWIVDLTDTTYLDSVGVCLLFTLSERLNVRRQALRLVVPEDALIRHVLTITDVESSVAMFTRLDEALRDPRSDPRSRS